MYKVKIPLKLPSANEYINACRTNVYMASALKRKVQKEISYYIRKLPHLYKPVKIKFIWVSEKGDRRDLDNICFAKKFILDALQENAILTNDNRKYVKGFLDDFIYGDKYEVRLEITEVTNDNRQDLQL